MSASGSSAWPPTEAPDAAVRAGGRPGPADRRRHRRRCALALPGGLRPHRWPGRGRAGGRGRARRGGPGRAGSGAPAGRPPGADRLLRLLPGARPGRRRALRRRSRRQPRAHRGARRPKAAAADQSTSGRPASRPGSCACSWPAVASPWKACGPSVPAAMAGTSPPSTLRSISPSAESAGSLSVRSPGVPSACPVPTVHPNESPLPVSDDLTPSATAVADPPAPDDSPFGTFDDEGNYVPRQIIENDLGAGLDEAYSATMVEVEDGQLVEGTVVKVDHDEVLLDIGYKSEGVIPSRELSIRNDVDPVRDRVAGRQHRGPRPHQGGQGGPPHPVQEAGPVRAGLGQDREDQGRRRRGHAARSSRSSRAA